jgi:thiamine biosynthesis lipoprotein ApbE
MGTVMTAAAWGRDSARLAAALDRAFDSVRLVDSGAARTRAVVLREARAAQRASGGAFDPALPGHFDAFARGYALDRVALALVGVADSALLDLGGQFLWVASGSPSGRPTSRRVGIADPENSLRVLTLVEMRVGSVSTTSQADRPSPSGRTRAVTVLAPTASAAAAWSTAFFALGCDSALALAPRLDGERVDVVCADSAGVRWTPALDGRVVLPRGARRAQPAHAP